MKWHVLDAVFKRNFVAYFSNPTGYVFICVFVLLGSLAAFWPPEFFNSNLANLDQLNRYLPYILLVFVPAITMSVWADERRQGTDELLLTIPASDWEVVFGKYLAAVGIFTVALVFSCLCNLVILLRWGTPDAGLFLANYLGYWFVGCLLYTSPSPRDRCWRSAWWPASSRATSPSASSSGCCSTRRSPWRTRRAP